MEDACETRREAKEVQSETAIRTVRVWLFYQNKRRKKSVTRRLYSGEATDRFDAESH